MKRSITCLLPLALAVGLVACDRPGEPVPTPSPDPVDPPTQSLTPLDEGGNDTATTTPPSADQAVSDALDTALAGAHRSDDNKARDDWRNPRQTLTFFGLRPDATVVEITPGGGWYTEILGPVLADNGKLLAATVDPATAPERARDYQTRALESLRDKLAADPALYASTEIVPFSQSEPVFGPDESADLVVTFRNVHNWLGSGAAPGMFEGFFKVLKPGGTLGVVEHKVEPGSPGDRENSGYMTEDAVIALATAAGFELAERSDINANPADTGDHPNGVWNLPPSLRVADDDDAEKYKAIGESNRMTLKFVKPRGDVILRQGMDRPDGSG